MQEEDMGGLTQRDDGDERAGAKKFPHEKVTKLWRSRIAYAEKTSEQNREDCAEAEAWYRGGEGEWGTKDSKEKAFWDGPKTPAGLWHRIVNVLASNLIHRNPRIVAKSEKGPQFDGYAKASAALGNKVYQELKYRDEAKRLVIEALFRNRSFALQTWDSYRWLPGLRWCAEEVYLDPDCHGDLRRAGWIAEQYTARLEELLDDPEISEEIKDELREHRDSHCATRVKGRDQDTKEEPIGSGAWDNQPGFTKVVCYRVWSLEGMCPGLKQEEEDDDQGSGAGSGTSDKYGLNPHAATDMPVDAAPHAQPENVDLGKRVYLLLVKNFPKVLKVQSWHMDHYDRDEFPYIRLKFTDLPGDLDGVPPFTVIRPIMKYVDFMYSFAMFDAKQSARRMIEIDEENIPDAAERQKIESGKHLEVIRTKRTGSISLVEFAARNPRYLELMPEMRRLLDEVTGVTDVMKGVNAGTAQTASEVQTLQDQSIAALTILAAAIEDMQEEIARKTVMACQRYIPKWTQYEPCPGCATPCDETSCEGASCQNCLGIGYSKGSGLVMPDGLEATDPITGPQPVQCQQCMGSGYNPKAVAAGQALRKGADWWLPPDLAAQWREDISVDQIRAEVVVSVVPGSSRRDFKERQLALVQQTFNQMGPFFEKFRLFRSLGELAKEVILGTELPNAETIVFSDEEWGRAIQQLMAQMAPPPEQPQGPPPEQIAQEQAQQQAQQQAVAEQKQAEMAQRQQEHASKLDLEHRKLSLEERRVAGEEASRVEASQSSGTMLAAVMKQLEAMQASREAQDAGLAGLIAQMTQAMAILGKTAATLSEASQSNPSVSAQSPVMAPAA